MSSLFKNTEIAFSIKTNAELERAYYLFKLIQKESLVKIGTALTKFALKTKMPLRESFAPRFLIISVEELPKKTASQLLIN